MAFAKLSPEGRYVAFVHEERTTSAFVAALAKLRGLSGLSQTKLSGVERGIALTSDASRNLDELMRRLEHLRDALRPVPIRFWNAIDIDELLKRVERQELIVICSVRDGQEPIVAA